MKQIRVFGVDDAPFTFSDVSVPLIGVVVRIPMYIEAVLKTEVDVDGIDATQKLIDIISNTKYGEQIRVIMIDGVCVAGFNPIDIQKIYEVLKVPVITVTRDKPDMRTIKSALKKHFSDWSERYEMISKSRLVKIRTKHNPIYVHHVGIDIKKVEEILTKCTVRGVLPEPLRIAHLIATGITKGESYGRA